MSDFYNNNKEGILLILSLVLLVVGIIFTMGGVMSLVGAPSRVDILGLLAGIVNLLGIPAGVSLAIGVTSLILAFVCYQKANA